MEPTKLKITMGDPRGVFYDLFPDEEAAELTEKAALLRAIQHRVRAKRIRRAELVRILGSQQTIEDMRDGRLSKFSMEQLQQYEKRLGISHGSAETGGGS